MKRFKGGLVCDCGNREKFPAYVYAHWREPLTYTCEKCGTKYTILMGIATKVEKTIPVPPPTFAPTPVFRVMAKQCPTCIFRPGNPMMLRPGRVKDMVATCKRRDSFVVCHEKLGKVVGPRAKGAVCRGFFDRYDTTPLQLARRLNAVKEIA
jgi:hypothetical protein